MCLFHKLLVCVMACFDFETSCESFRILPGFRIRIRMFLVTGTGSKDINIT